jgi:hypothetical protein
MCACERCAIQVCGKSAEGGHSQQSLCPIASIAATQAPKRRSMEHPRTVRGRVSTGAGHLRLGRGAKLKRTATATVAAAMPKAPPAAAHSVPSQAEPAGAARARARRLPRREVTRGHVAGTKTETVRQLAR